MSTPRQDFEFIYSFYINENTLKTIISDLTTAYESNDYRYVTFKDALFKYTNPSVMYQIDGTRYNRVFEPKNIIHTARSLEFTFVQAGEMHSTAGNEHFYSNKLTIVPAKGDGIRIIVPAGTKQHKELIKAFEQKDNKKLTMMIPYHVFNFS